MGNSPLVGNGELPGGEFRAFVSTQLSLVPSLLCDRCVIELQLLSFSTCIYSYGYFIWCMCELFCDACLCLLARTIRCHFCFSCFASLSYDSHFFPFILFLFRYLIVLLFLLLTADTYPKNRDAEKKVRCQLPGKNNESFHSPLKYCSPKF